MSWFFYSDGKALDDQLRKAKGVNVKGFMLQPVYPEALGRFKQFSPVTGLAILRPEG